MWCSDCSFRRRQGVGSNVCIHTPCRLFVACMPLTPCLFRYLIISTLQAAIAMCMVGLWVRVGRAMSRNPGALEAERLPVAHTVLPTMEVGVEAAKECWTSPTESTSTQSHFSGAGNGILPTSSDLLPSTPQGLLAEPSDILQAAATNCG